MFTAPIDTDAHGDGLDSHSSLPVSRRVEDIYDRNRIPSPAIRRALVITAARRPRFFYQRGQQGGKSFDTSRR